MPRSRSGAAASTFGSPRRSSARAARLARRPLRAADATEVVGGLLPDVVIEWLEVFVEPRLAERARRNGVELFPRRSLPVRLAARPFACFARVEDELVVRERAEES